MEGMSVKTDVFITGGGIGGLTLCFEASACSGFQ
ncbi:hypothetical protein HMPREF1210_02766 [Paenisporosarcina sp. HGH0030]|nr:hypothetical protein HMPREF1210_02766 [Paenisporosarcina sp. HGH0030]